VKKNMFKDGPGGDAAYLLLQGVSYDVQNGTVTLDDQCEAVEMYLNFGACCTLP